MRLARISSRVASSGARRCDRARRTSAWGRASSPTARPCISMPWPAKRAGVDERAARCRARSSPSASASRRAGSIVTTATRAARRPRAPSRSRPRSSSCRRRPSPAQITTRLPSQPRALTRARSSGPARARSIAARVELAAETGTAASRPAPRAPRRSRASWARCARARGVARRAPRAPAATAARASSAPRVGGVKRVRQHAVDDDAGDASGRPRRRSASASASVSLTGISSGRATATTPVCAGSDSIASMIRALARDAAHARRVGERARRGQHRDAVAGRGRVEDHEVVGRRRRACGGRPARAPRPCRPSAARAARASRRRSS